MKPFIKTFILLIFIHYTASAQVNHCDLLKRLINQANRLDTAGKFIDALNKFYSARVAARNCPGGNVKSVDSLILNVNNKIIALREKAEKALKAANLAEHAAKIAASQAKKSAFEVVEAQRKADSSSQKAALSTRITEASRLLTVALQVKEDDPTLALQLIKQACDISYFNFKPAIEAFQSIVSTTKSASFYLNKFEKLGEDVSSVALSENGRFLIVGSYAGLIDVWDLTKTSESGVGNPIATNKGHKGAVLSLVTSVDGSIIVSGGTDGAIHLWNSKLERKTISQARNNSAVLSLAISADERHLVSSSEDKTVNVWNLTGTLEKKIALPYGNGLQVCFSPDGKYIGIAGNDEVVRVWDWQSGKVVAVLEGHLGAVRSVAFSSDGKYIVSGGDDKTVKVWDLKTSTIKHTFQGHQGSVTSVAFPSDTSYIVSTSQDKTIKIWDVHNNQLYRELRGHQKAVFAAGFYKNGRYVYSGSYDRSVKLWDWKQENKLYPNFKFPEDYDHKQSSQDKELNQLQLSVGKRKIFSQNDTTLFSKCIVTQGADHTIWLWASDTASKPVFIISTPDPIDPIDKLPQLYNNISIIKSTELYQAFYGKLIRATEKLIPVMIH